MTLRKYMPTFASSVSRGELLEGKTSDHGLTPPQDFLVLTNLKRFSLMQCQEKNFSCCNCDCEKIFVIHFSGENLVTGSRKKYSLLSVSPVSNN